MDGGFHFVSVMSNAALDICVQISVWIYVHFSWLYILGCGIAGSHCNSVEHVEELTDC